MIFFYSKIFDAIGERDFFNRTDFTDFANQFSIFSLTDCHLVTEQKFCRISQ
jgi:hypothetical protein